MWIAIKFYIHLIPSLSAHSPNHVNIPRFPSSLFTNFHTNEKGAMAPFFSKLTRISTRVFAYSPTLLPTPLTANSSLSLKFLTWSWKGKGCEKVWGSCSMHPCGRRVGHRCGFSEWWLVWFDSFLALNRPLFLNSVIPSSTGAKTYFQTYRGSWTKS